MLRPDFLVAAILADGLVWLVGDNPPNCNYPIQRLGILLAAHGFEPVSEADLGGLHLALFERGGGAVNKYGSSP